jgi:EsV-1-7 cysteine-rich motif
MTDVVNRRCAQSGCKRRAMYGAPGEAAQWCVNHKGEGMVDTSYRRCEDVGCPKWPLYAYEGEKARFCRYIFFVSVLALVFTRSCGVSTVRNSAGLVRESATVCLLWASWQQLSAACRPLCSAHWRQ